MIALLFSAAQAAGAVARILEITMKWIAAAFDSARVCEIGNSPEEAEALYEAAYGRPRYGFWRFSNRDEYKTALQGVGEAMGHTVAKSIRLFEASEWICVTPITPEAIRRVQLGGLDTLVHDWTDPDGGYRVTVMPPPPQRVSPADISNAKLQETLVSSFANSSERLRRMTKYRDLEQLSWAIDAGREPGLSAEEMADVTRFYDAAGIFPSMRIWPKK